MKALANAVPGSLLNIIDALSVYAIAILINRVLKVLAWDVVQGVGLC